MSGIYINGIEMPKLGYREIRIYPDGRVIEEDECGIDEVVGTAEQVPSHGRLIDADALRAFAYQRQKETGIACCVDALDIRLAPTIIPAEIISENEIKIIDTKGKSNYDPKRRFVISTTNKE